jgi:hypothetical protein
LDHTALGGKVSGISSAAERDLEELDPVGGNAPDPANEEVTVMPRNLAVEIPVTSDD